MKAESPNGAAPNGTDPPVESGESAFERFERLTRHLVSIPKRAEKTAQRKDRPKKVPLKRK